ncbi:MULTISPECIES: type IV pilin protein [Comamonas]|uniref:type IV pilin protein n=1 Tax=Comamonas TaxID=283 RepID=UPI002111689B|nr:MULTISPECIES: type IV pilin protein [Comamonas]UUC94916.1 type IV pilin protein [Comamonas sp. C11]WEE78954.1 type IV pilin protein [Comamonas testosteroni]
MIHRIHKNQRGFTLIELMIVLAVVGILSAVAYPSYTEYVRRGHRADARTGLLQAQMWMERAATATGVYPTNADTTKILPAALSWTGDASKRYTIGVKADTSTNSTYTLIATRKDPGPQAADKCGDFTLTHTGARGAENLSSEMTATECWSK